MPESRSKALTIRTPEGIEFSMPLAGPISRFLALVVDMLSISVALKTLSIAFHVLSAIQRELGLSLQLLAAFVVGIGYAILLEWVWRGQTLGKKLLRLRVIDEQGLRVRFSQIVVRNLLRPVDILPLFYMVGGLFCMLHGHGQRLGDIAAGTVVVRVPGVSKPNLEKLSGDKFNSLRQYPHLTLRLLRTTPPEDAFLALRALLRREELDPPARVALFRELAAHFKTLVPFPQEVLDGLTDERYVRNVVDVLFRPRSVGPIEKALTLKRMAAKA